METGEVSSASKIERLNFSLNVLRSPDSRGGHFEYRGLGPKGEVIEHIHPQHRHEVSLDFTRIELGIRYFMRNALALSLDLPYDIKNQKAWVDFLGRNQTPENRDAILANRDIHHRTETYTGLSDFEFSVNYYSGNLLRLGEKLVFSLGMSLPIGKIEEDPYRLGDAGKKHLHIQFGTGTFVPIIKFQHSIKLLRKLALHSYVTGRLPFYENGKAYRAPTELNYNFGVRYRISNSLALNTHYTGLYQHYGYWDGERDRNTGLIVNALLFGASVSFWDRSVAQFNLIQPLGQKMLSEDSDTFKRGLTFLLTFSFPLL
ncbi:TPA: hypothetical protein EYG59_17830 [Candidatus Poribacteria bacterium]|nr:hypothetical protein [Candidatus Poribacteria bacterium]HIO80444.1 hypothetical protein [Candidatus Poribacteria bacterium]